MTTIAKPQLRGLHAATLKPFLAGFLVTTFVGTMIFKVLYNDRRRKRYAHFYKTYDPEKQLKIMNDAGLMHSCPK